MSELVTIPQHWEKHPVYHAQGHEFTDSKEPNDWVYRWYDKTPCGVRQKIAVTTLRRDHADLFAQPCRRCFPESEDA